MIGKQAQVEYERFNRFGMRRLQAAQLYDHQKQEAAA
jgi:hypothetical protein